MDTAHPGHRFPQTRHPKSQPFALRLVGRTTMTLCRKQRAGLSNIEALETRGMYLAPSGDIPKAKPPLVHGSRLRNPIAIVQRLTWLDRMPAFDVLCYESNELTAFTAGNASNPVAPQPEPGLC